MANSESNNKLLLREDTIPREAPYYCFEFIIYNTKQSFQLFYEQNFPKLSRLFALGLGRSLFFANASKQPLDLQCKFVEKRFWWDFNYDKMERCLNAHSQLTFGGGERIGVFKQIFSSLNSSTVESLVPGLKGLSVTGSERILLVFRNNLSLEEVKDSLRDLLKHENCHGCVLYSRIDDLHPEHHTQSNATWIVELLFSRQGIQGCGKHLVNLKKQTGNSLQWGVFKEERFLPVEYQFDMRYPSIIGRLHGY
ncbi:uncharacterized protein LOC142349293 [Convolutriloba macropyga]|uniref:uncharacterized protein LOC142349293 n=1 Tax=Convolutriloba macropyga TaxID=536237 RepID=UPI003F521D7C